MSAINAIILGIIQGITYFLPVSSSGHISIICNLFDLAATDNEHIFFDVMLHLGTVFSVCIVYWNDIAGIISELRSSSARGSYQNQNVHRPYTRLLFMISLATLPLLLILPINSNIQNLFGRNIFIGIMLILTGCLLFVSDKFLPGEKTELNISVFDAIIIGLCQSVSAIPGLSQPGVTITAGLATGLKREFAFKFAFLLSVPAVLGANIVSLISAAKRGIMWSSVPAYLLGTVFSMITGIFVLSFVKRFANKIRFSGFAYYCWLAGVMSIVLTLIF